MTDKKIVELFFRRDEQAIHLTAQHYGNYSKKIAMNILNNSCDSEECVNDAYMQLWNSIPPQNPSSLMAYLAKITRNLAINRYQSIHAKKRKDSEYALSLDELAECIAHPSTPETEMDNAHLTQTLNHFVRTLPDETRRVFVCRYFYCESIADIAVLYHMSESKVKSILFRTRNKLKKYLEEGDITL